MKWYQKYEIGRIRYLFISPVLIPSTISPFSVQPTKSPVEILVGAIEFPDELTDDAIDLRGVLPVSDGKMLIYKYNFKKEVRGLKIWIDSFSN